MNNQMLLPGKWRWPGMLLFLIGGVAGILNFYGSWEWDLLDYSSSSENTLVNLGDQNFTNELALSFVLIGLLILCFTKVPHEDEYVFRHRLLSWQWSVLINYILLFIANWTLYEGAFFSVMLFGMLSVPMIFLIRFYFVLFSMRNHEE